MSKLTVNLLLVGFGIFVAAVAGTVVFQQPAGGATNPVEAATPQYMTPSDMGIITMHDAPSDMVGCLANCWFAGPVNSRLVVFQDRSSDDPNEYKAGVIYQHGSSWHRTYEASGSWTAIDSANRSLQANVHLLAEGTGWNYRWGFPQDYVMTVGFAADESITRVELVHDTGQIVAAYVTAGYFIAFAPAGELCEIRGRDYTGAMVERLQAGESIRIRTYGPLKGSDHCAEILDQAETS